MLLYILLFDLLIQNNPLNTEWLDQFTFQNPQPPFPPPNYC